MVHVSSAFIFLTVALSAASTSAAPLRYATNFFPFKIPKLINLLLYQKPRGNWPRPLPGQSRT
jgi:hypothetical protein